MNPRIYPIILLATLIATGCPDPDKPINDDTGPSAIDADGDGYTADEDCDDSDPDIFPGAEEECDELDNDCDGEIDEGTDHVYYGDSDGDGYGDAGTTIEACEPPTGYVENAEDCDDSDPLQYPGADEYCNGEDDDCDGETDEEGVLGASTWYADDDGDGYGDAGVSMDACDAPTGYVDNSDDCDDSDPMQNPDGTEICNGEDDDCDGEVDEDEAMDTATWYADADGDGYGDTDVTIQSCERPKGYVNNDDDCDDGDSAQYPGATEYCNGEDDDCDLDVDEDDASDVATWYADADSDGYGDADVSDIDCDQPSGYVSNDGDCDDADPLQNPDADEICNGEDDDCDGTVDEDDAIDVSTWYADDDNDGYGDAGVSDIDCNQPKGYVSDDTDCDDRDPMQNPAASEVCNGEDDDCDGTVDEADAIDASTWYADSDSDGFGNASVTDLACDQPTGYVADATDCDDSDPLQYPGADELCNGEDDDCDGTVDEDDAIDVSTWYADMDSDGFGNPAATDIDCTQPSGYVADGTDCDDSDPLQFPGADEYCNGEDDDCDGTVDEDDAIDASTWYADTDSDTYGDAGNTDVDCDQPSGYVADDTDCDDSDAAQFPGADEYCNGEDDDCDGYVDEDGEVLDGDTYYADTDGDLAGDPDNTILACSRPSGYVENTWDCDDGDATEPVVVDAATGSASGAGTMSSPLDTVQAGIDQALSCVIVMPGTYSEAVSTNGTDLLITGVEGSDTTIIDAIGSGEAALSIENGETTATVVTGFTLVGDGHLTVESSSYGCTSIVTCTDWFYTYCGGGAYINNSDPTFVDINAEGSALPAASTTVAYPDTTYVYSYGGGMCFQNSNSMVSESRVALNYADQGGGVYADETSAISFGQSYVLGNEASDGGGFEIEGGLLDTVNVASAFNLADAEGGGLFLVDAGASVVNTTYAGDDALSGGGVYASGASSVEMANSIVYGAASGEGVLIDSGSTFTGSYNNVFANGGGNYSGITDPTGTDGNISIVPLFVSYTDDGNITNDDLHLNPASSLIDAGDPSPSYQDADGTDNDIGAFGGPGSDWD
jgi:hypothetical protein